MTNRLKQFLVLFAVGALFVGCVKDRPITKVPDPNRDLMPKSIYTGDLSDPAFFAYKVTVVKTSANGGFTFTGYQSDMKIGYFEFSREKLRFLNSNVSNRFQQQIQSSPEILNEWDIDHIDYRLAESDGYTTNREEENNYIDWERRRNFKIKWAEANITEAASFPWTIDVARDYSCWQKKSSELVDGSRELTNEHISFTVRVDYQQNSLCTSSARSALRGDFVFSVDYKYSFRRMPKGESTDYKPYQYTGEDDDLERKYGYFQTILETRDEDNRLRNVFFMNRWNPNKSHTIYFAEDFPEKYKVVFYETICNANRVFAKNGLNDYPMEGSCRKLADNKKVRDLNCTTGICFNLRENDGSVKFGDLRYSFFKVIEELEVGPFGYGPSDANPFSGEIIASNTMVWTGTLGVMLKRLKVFIDRMDPTRPVLDDRGFPVLDPLGQIVLESNPKYRYAQSSLFQKMTIALGEDHTQWTSSSTNVAKEGRSRLPFEYLLTKMTYGYPGWNSFTYRSNYPGLMSKPENYRPSGLDESLFDFTAFDQVQDLAGKINMPGRAKMSSNLEESKAVAEEFIRSQSFGATALRDSLVYPFDDVVVDAVGLFYQGLSIEEVQRRILVQVALHEFGHNLGLRHNFYGSFDAKNFRKNEDGSFESHSSSVMDYLDFRDEVVGVPQYEAYDEAAIVFAYSGGKKDLSNERKTNYMYCTDEHTILNALCNRHDSGTTPSQVVKSLIERYDEYYEWYNYRFDRAYWNTSGYARYVFSTMLQLKKPLMMWRTAFKEVYIAETLNDSATTYSQGDVNRITYDVETDIKKAIKLSIAFYDSVIQQAASVRPWQTVYHPESGAVERVGIIHDKIYAMLFLMGDSGFSYNPNHSLNQASFLTYIYDYGYKDMVEKILENTLTVRVDMEPWFIGFGRLLYSINASNYYNRDLDAGLLEKVALRCYTPEGLHKRFGIDPFNFMMEGAIFPTRLDTAVVEVEDYADKIKDPYFLSSNEYLGITLINGNYYVASSTQNKYAFTIIDNMRRRDHTNEYALGIPKFDVQETYMLYNLAANFYIPQNCDNGAGL